MPSKLDERTSESLAFQICQGLFVPIPCLTEQQANSYNGLPSVKKVVKGKTATEVADNVRRMRIFIVQYLKNIIQLFSIISHPIAKFGAEWARLQS